LAGIFQIKEFKNGLTFQVQVVPRASRAEIAGIQEGALKIKITALPVDGAANEACLKLLAKALKLKKGQMEILAGAKSRKKIVLITDVNKKDLEAKIKNILE
jgi:uncharacterized protein (TIGR00251 family)